ncbi:MAG: cysteine peptidase family C39 domain-containing protein [Verrucomicrobiota bacterium]
MKIYLVLLLLLAAAVVFPAAAQDASFPSPTPIAGTPLDPVFAADAVWETSPDQLIQNNPALRFRWLSTTHDSAQTILKGATLFGLPICQTIIHFEGDKLNDVTVLIYNRGDAGEISRATYEGMVKNAVTAISAATKTKFTARGKDVKSAVRAEGLTWETEKSTYLLEYSATRDLTPSGIPFRAEFIRLRIAPRAKPKSLFEDSRAESKKPDPFRGPSHVVTDSVSGDVSIKDIPMVDQGEKGYCVVAACERVLRYYGIKVDANELAQLANSSATVGTSVEAMTESLKKLSFRLKFRITTGNQLDVPTLLALIRDYNLAARRAKSALIPAPGHILNIQQIYAQMKGDLLREVRTKNRSPYMAFKRGITAQVGKGLPLLWSVMLGIIPEPGANPPIPSGHMRLIIGYNEKTDEILFSDSWGMGHELKRMPAADAWTITTSTSSIEPFFQ